MNADFTFVRGPAFEKLLEAPPMQTFRVVYPAGQIQEWDGFIVPGPLMDDGTMDAQVSVLSIVREGSIYDKEGAD